MSEVWGRLRVRETSGIRRFLYPLAAYVNLPLRQKLGESKTDSEMYGKLALVTTSGENVPRQMTSLTRTFTARLDFALSLAPYETQELMLATGDPLDTVPDALRITPNPGRWFERYSAAVHFRS